MGRLSRALGGRVYLDANIVVYAVQGFESHSRVVKALLDEMDEDFLKRQEQRQKNAQVSGSRINGDFSPAPPSSSGNVDFRVKFASTLYFPLLVI